LYLDKRTKPVALINALALAINIGLNLILIPRFEIVGAAAATLVSFALLAVLGMLASRSAAGVRFELGRQAGILSIVLGAAAAAYAIDARAVASDAPAALGLKAAILVLLLGGGWALLLRSGERAAFGRWLRQRLGRGRA
ncbi:MAG TPA: polysaccharide biosynthesis C-terminal domain-containing protein, partial [Planctomycetota bacterium]|nr:polysaccharide biosynthesis C-terminal domain-containing protein [Planctomycetota bacterium]